MGLLRVISSDLVSCFVLLVEIIRLGLFPDLLRLPRSYFVLVDSILRSVLGKSLLLNELWATRLVILRVLPFIVHNHDFLSFLGAFQLLLGHSLHILLVSRVWTSAYVAERHIRVQCLLTIIGVLVIFTLLQGCQSTSDLLLRFLVRSINNGRRDLQTFFILIGQPILLICINRGNVILLAIAPILENLSLKLCAIIWIIILVIVCIPFVFQILLDLLLGEIVWSQILKALGGSLLPLRICLVSRVWG